MMLTLLNHFAAVLVATGTVAPDPHAVKVADSAKLARAKTPATAERLCTIEWERDSDAWWSCVVGLETWRGEVQGWATGGPRVTEAMPLVDAAFAGRIDWDAI
jgi:hypothetical protein